MIRSIVIGDGGPAFESLKGSLARVEEVQVVGELALRGAAAAIEAMSPELIVLDEPAWMPLALAIIREARCAAPAAVLIVRATYVTPDWLANAQLAGASAILPAVADGDALDPTIHEELTARENDPDAFRLGWAA